jgi:hypothetical protein
MKNQIIPPNHIRQDKDSYFEAEWKKFYEYLLTHTATASMVTSATGIPQKNITRYKDDLQKANRLWELEEKPCKITNRMAWYLTTNPEMRNTEPSPQLLLF